MKELPTNLIAKKNLVSTRSAWLPILVIVMEDGTTFRLVRNNEDVAKREDDYAVNGCIGHWKMNDNDASTTVEDSSANGNDGEAERDTDVIVVEGKINTGLRFNGVVDYITIGDIAELEGLAAISFATWVYPSAAQKGTIFAKNGPYSLEMLATRQLTFGVFTTGVPWNYMTTTGTLTLNTWNLVVCTYDGTTMKVSINGAAFETQTHTLGGDLGTSSNTLKIGYGSAPWDNYFSGRMDNFMIFDRALSFTEVEYLFNNAEGTETIPIIYTAMSFQLDVNTQSGKGDIPILSCKVANVGRLLEPKLEEFGGGIGAAVKVAVVNSELLYADYSEIEMDFEVLSCSTNATWVNFTLGTPSLLRQQYPPRKYYAMHCPFASNFKGAECGYSGAGDTCDGTLEACRNYSNSDRFGGFPGMRTGTVRIVG